MLQMKSIVIFFSIMFIKVAALACTTFCINNNGHIVFGRNYDWITGAGIMNSNQRGMFKTSMVSENGNSLSWVAKYGSLTFNQYGKEFPTGGMNEKGLVVELMWLDGTKYPAADARPAIGVLQWIQYQLDNAADINEVIRSDSRLRISEKATPLHYLIADAAGNVAAIEFLAGKMVVHQGNDLPFPVLTNDTYQHSSSTKKSLGKQNDQSIQDNSLDRFVKACNMVQKFKAGQIKKPITEYAFSILDAVSQGNYTQWSIVYDITNKQINFRTADNKKIRSVRFSAFEFSCNKPSKMFLLDQDIEGDISQKFILSDKKIKNEILHKAVTESNSRVQITKKEEEALSGYEYGIKCAL